MKIITAAVLGTALALSFTAAHSASLSDLTKAAKSLLDKNSEGSSGTSLGGLNTDEITAGLKEALTTGSNAVVSQLGTTEGFSSDPAIRIPLPSSLAKARNLAKKIGLEGSFDDLELKLNLSLIHI